MDNANVKIGSRIRHIRKENGLTMKALADMIGVSEQAISQYELGKRPLKTNTIKMIADKLGVSPRELLEDDEEWGYGAGSRLHNMEVISSSAMDDLTPNGKHALTASLAETVGLIAPIEDAGLQEEYVDSLALLIQYFGRMLVDGWEMREKRANLILMGKKLHDDQTHCIRIINSLAASLLNEAEEAINERAKREENKDAT